MAFIDMASELQEAIPGLDRIYAKTLIKRAWRVVQDANLWSFQLQQGGMSTPQVLTAGSISTSLGSNTLIGDSVATAAWSALPFMFAPTVQQIRANGYSTYSIIAFDTTTNAPYGTLTLDRPFVDPLPFYTGVGYQHERQAYQQHGQGNARTRQPGQPRQGLLERPELHLSEIREHVHQLC